MYLDWEIEIVSKKKKTAESIKRNVGYPYVFVFIPFCFDNQKTEEYLKKETLKKNKDYVNDFYLSNHIIEGKKPTEMILKQMFFEDKEVYSDNYIKSHPFTRIIMPEYKYANMTFDIELKVILNFHNDGYGSIILINKICEPCTHCEFLNIMKKFTMPHQLIMEFDNLKISVNEIITSFFDYRYNIPLGQGYQYVVFSSNNDDFKIQNIDDFINSNLLELYGVLFQDYSGWDRTREDVAKKYLNHNIARRKEYKLFVAPMAAIEIDSEERYKIIKKWAVEDKIDFEFLLIKLLMERALLFEMLIIQRHLMHNIDDLVSNALSENQISSKILIETKVLISEGLHDYYNIQSQSQRHVTGVEWITYGQQQLRLENLYDSVIKKIETFETLHNMIYENKSKNSATIFTFISLILAMTAIDDLVGIIMGIPFIPQVIIKNSWLISLCLFLVLFGIIVIVLIKSFLSTKNMHYKRRGQK